MIETYFHKGEGYAPFLIREGWQVAQLNYLPGHGFEEIGRMEVHRDTDEVFILFKGNAVLIEGNSQRDGIQFFCEKMRPGITYNIPAGTWHNIAMDADTEIIIVEKSGTHTNDCDYLDLEQPDQMNLYMRIKRELA